MDLYEYQGKELFRRFGIPVSEGRLATTPDEARAAAHELGGQQASEIAKEYYLSVTFDRGAKKPLFMLTTEGGVEIEQVADEKPEALARLHVDPLEGFQPYQ